MLGRKVLVRSTSEDFAAQVRGLLRSFPGASGGGVPPPAGNASADVTLSFIVAPPSRSRSIRPFHFAYFDYHQAGRTTSYWQLFRHLEFSLDKFLAEEVRDRYLLQAGVWSRMELRGK